jgi:hypothetical protein
MAIVPTELCIPLEKVAITSAFLFISYPRRLPASKPFAELEPEKELLHIYKTQKLENESFESFDSRVLSSLDINEIQKRVGL